MRPLPNGDASDASRPRVSATTIAVAAAVAAAVLVRALRIADPHSLDAVPDDAFIALDVARRLAATGVLPTSGVQPLFVYLAAPIFAIARPDTLAGLDAAARASLAICAAADVVTLVLLARLLRRAGGPVAAAVGAWIWALHPGIAAVATNGLETSLALAMICAVVTLAELGSPSPRRDFALGALVGAGMLARVDLASLGAGIVLVELWDRRKSEDDVRAIGRRVVPLAAGFAAVYLPWVAALYAQTGDVLPVSGKATALLAYQLTVQALSLPGESFWPGILRNGLGAVAFRAAPFAAISLAALPFARGFSRFRLVGWHAAAVYVFYTFYVGAWWHFERYFAPVLLVQTAAVALACGRLAESRPRAAAVVVVVALAAVAVSLAASIPIGSRTDRYRTDALAVRPVVPAGAVVGAWESGALSYYLTDATVVNLDGVADSRAYEAIRDKRLDEYMLERGVTTVVSRPGGVGFVGINSAHEPHFEELPNPGMEIFRRFSFSVPGAR